MSFALIMFVMAGKGKSKHEDPPGKKDLSFDFSDEMKFPLDLPLDAMNNAIKDALLDDAILLLCFHEHYGSFK